MHAREPGTAVRSLRELGVDEAKSASPHEHGRTVEDVLARRTEMHVTTILLADAGADRPHQWLDGIPRCAAFRRDRVVVVVLDPQRPADRSGNLRRDEARGRLGVHERALGIEHRFEPGVVRESLRQLSRDENRRERAHDVKKTVSEGPWR
jgi:hypothetical protein